MNLYTVAQLKTLYPNNRIVGYYNQEDGASHGECDAIFILNDQNIILAQYKDIYLAESDNSLYTMYALNSECDYYPMHDVTNRSIYDIIDEWCDSFNLFEELQPQSLKGYTPKEAFDLVSTYDIKAVVVDYTSTELYVNHNGKTTVYHDDNDGDGIYEGLTINETAENCLNRVMNGSFVDLHIVKEV